MITRIVKLPYHDNVLVGRDLANNFDSGHVYNVRKVLGEFLIEDLGESSLCEKTNNNYPNPYSKAEDIMCSGEIYFTKEELEKK